MEERYLFRGKRKDNGEWVTGQYVKGLDMYDKEVHLIFEPTTMFYSSGETDGWSEIDPSTICQCTGLKDKNGKLIWENDIVCHKYNAYTEYDTDFPFEHNRKRKNYVIKWDSTMVYCGFRYHNGRNIFPLKNETVTNGNDEVIGNIFDNAGLLESEG